MDELEEAEKGQKGGADISLGLSRPDDTYMSDWQASIFSAPGGAGEPRMWSLKIHCCKDYPKLPPQISFTSKIALDIIDGKGNVVAAKVPYLASWNSSKNMYGALNEIKLAIGRASRAQPPESATF